MRFSYAQFGLVFSAALGFTMVAACGGKAVIFTEQLDAGRDDGGNKDSGSEGTCSTRRGVCIPVVPSARCPAGYASTNASCGGEGSSCCEPAPPPGRCQVGQDQECNANPASSGLSGRCVNGECLCNPGAAKDPISGKCSSDPIGATSCADVNGRCIPVGNCGVGVGSLAVSRYTCANPGASTVCCVPTERCGVENFVCNAPNDACSRPTCEPKLPAGSRLFCSPPNTPSATCQGG